MFTFKWSGEMARASSLERLREAETRVKNVHLANERSRYPDGLPMDESRREALGAIADAVGKFALHELNTEVAQLPPPDSDHIRFYDSSEFAKLDPEIEDLTTVCNAFNTPHSYFICVRERSGPNSTLDTLTSTQHEFIHHGGRRTYSLSKNSATGLIDINLVSSGLYNQAEGKFGLLDEALVVALNRDTRQKMWSEYEILKPYAHQQDEDVRDALSKRQLTKPLYFGLLFDYICDKASYKCGSDVKAELYAAHYSGDQGILDVLGEALGEQVVSNLSEMTPDSTQEAILRQVAHQIGREGEFCNYVKSQLAAASIARATA